MGYVACVAVRRVNLASKMLSLADRSSNPFFGLSGLPPLALGPDPVSVLWTQLSCCYVLRPKPSLKRCKSLPIRGRRKPLFSAAALEGALPRVNEIASLMIDCDPDENTSYSHFLDHP